MDDEGADPVAARIRVGHDERTTAMRALDAHLEAGRLDVGEYGDRSAAAGGATYRDELDALFRDLPEPHPAPAVAVVPAYPHSPDRHGARLLVAVPVLLVIGLVALAVTGYPGGVVLLPLVFVLMGRFGHRRRPF